MIALKCMANYKIKGSYDFMMNRSILVLDTQINHLSDALYSLQKQHLKS